MHPINTNSYEILNYNSKKFIFIGNYKTLFEYTDLLNDILKLLSNHNDDEIVNKLEGKYSSKLVREQVSIIKEWILKINSHNENQYNLNNNIERDYWHKEKVLKSLWLNISHDCNLRCIYCYGDGGNYGKRTELMTVEKAKEIIDYWFKYLNKESKEVNVVFFGGEPLMNKDVLFFAVDYINNLIGHNKNIKYMLTTNATIMDSKLLDLFTKNKFSITLSIDGEKEIQDKNRPYCSGEGTFNKVIETIGLLKKSYNKLTARLTLTHDNVPRLKQSIEDLWNLGITNVNFEIVSSKDKSLKLTEEDIKILKPQIQDLAKITYRNIIDNNNKYILTFIKYGKILHNYLDNSCTFYSKNSLMVDPDGEIFKCHRLIEQEEFMVGNISNELDWGKYNKNKNTNSKCDDCWINKLCFQCPQINYTFNNNIYDPYELSCELTKIIVEESLKLYCSIYENYPKLLSQIYKC
ncbi:radical SAM domain-containing protein [Gottschalkia acidurici 9a]|uniref:Radical SAM domain-containing protein n=1 Tax=Gottschalkia acidurici (strain ATCC 7906 / DSM 604 / BCRC 14475 / CIP 104303 / KCTC 5404 / NCIMB 10678 / 9a) TaxID=1128398 RepID=K0AZR9_GOTA9|nr:radical SAM protein [Gottschalkia acidurici]AFS77851.1 radical SAM domain-containing protein [Gottschalkia acidurici 9a]